MNGKTRPQLTMNAPRNVILHFVVTPVVIFLRNFVHLLSINAPTCRFDPTCLEYSKKALLDFGLWKGAALTIRRLLRCHPFASYGWDPVPPKTSEEFHGK